MSLTLEQKLLFGFGVTSFMFALALSVAIDNSDQLKRTSTLVVHTQEVLGSLQAVQLALAEGENAVRGFLASGEETRLTAFRELGSKLENEMRRLRQLTNDNVHQQRRIPLLELAIGRRLALLDSVVRHAQDEGTMAGPIQLDQAEATRQKADIRQVLAEMRFAEEQLLKLRQQDSAENDRKAGGIQLVLGILILTSLVGSYLLVRHHLKQRRQAERKIEAASERIQDLYNKAPCGYHSLDENGVFVNVNHTELGWFGYERDELIAKKRFSEVLTEEGQRVFLANFPRFKEQGWIKDLELECVRKDGSQFTALLNATAAYDSTGKFLTSRSTMFDITSRKHAELERDRFFTLTVDMLCIAHANGYFKRVNPAFTETLGWSVDELQTRPFLDFVHPDDQAATLREVERQVVAGQPVLHFENRYRHKDGSWHVLSWRSVPHGDGMMYATARDVTGLKQAEQRIQQLNEDLERRAGQLEAANKELEAFSYSVSHDLRAPLRHIQGYLEMLQQAAASQLSEKALRYMGVIADASREMSQLIDDLLAFSRMGRVGMQAGCVRLDELVSELIQHQVVEPAGRRINFKIGALPTVRGDATMLKQVLANLIGNAVKYTRDRDPAEIEIGHAGEEEGWVTCFIKDNGAGFDMEYAHKLFGVFQRLHRADEFEGTGIGLAIVRRIIARHGGRTWAQGALNCGATFYFSLRAHSDASIALPPHS